MQWRNRHSPPRNIHTGNDLRGLRSQLEAVRHKCGVHPLFHTVREIPRALEALGLDRTRLFPVQLGMYSDGLVEIEGPGLEAGMIVIVPE